MSNNDDTTNTKQIIGPTVFGVVIALLLSPLLGFLLYKNTFKPIFFSVFGQQTTANLVNKDSSFSTSQRGFYGRGRTAASTPNYPYTVEVRNGVTVSYLVNGKKITSSYDFSFFEYDGGNLVVTTDITYLPFAPSVFILGPSYGVKFVIVTYFFSLPLYAYLFFAVRFLRKNEVLFEEWLKEILGR